MLRSFDLVNDGTLDIATIDLLLTYTVTDGMVTIMELILVSIFELTS